MQSGIRWGLTGRGLPVGRERERERVSARGQRRRAGGSGKGLGEGVVLGGRAREETMESKRNRKRGVGGRERGRKEGEREGRTKEDAPAHIHVSPVPARLSPAASYPCSPPPCWSACPSRFHWCRLGGGLATGPASRRAHDARDPAGRLPRLPPIKSPRRHPGLGGDHSPPLLRLSGLTISPSLPCGRPAHGCRIGCGPPEVLAADEARVSSNEGSNRAWKLEPQTFKFTGGPALPGSAPHRRFLDQSPSKPIPSGEVESY